MAKLTGTYKGSMFKYRLFLLIFTLIYWNVVIRLAIFLRVLGAKSNDISEVFSKGLNFVIDEIILSSLIISVFATLSWFVLNFLYPGAIRKYRIRRLTIFVILVDIGVFAAIGILLGIVHYSIDSALPFGETLAKLDEFLFNSTVLFFLIVLFVGSYVYQLANTLLHQIGYLPLGKVMMGYYQRPREENQIFVFLDLQSSSLFAEKLGHERYSYFIQDCFRFISNSLLVTLGRVYQFVGDEVVITWNANNKQNFKRAVDFYYLFEEELKKRKPYFEEKYGLMPVFTAAINSGNVMATEVGEIKRELAYHGDVLNTAARIQKQCKRYRKDILVTKVFAAELQRLRTGYKIRYVDLIKFLGKDRRVKIYEVYREDQE